MKNVGLWISNKKAVLVVTIKTKVDIHQVFDTSEELSKSRDPQSFENCSPTIPRDPAVFLQPHKDYFEHIINYISGAKGILIVGPDATTEFFYKYLRNYNTSICNNVCNVKHMNYMSDSKIANYFMNFFSMKK